MFVVYLLSQGGVKSSFQMPWRLAAIVPGRLLPINRYRPNWKYKRGKSGILSAVPDVRQALVGRKVLDRSVEPGSRQRQIDAPKQPLVIRGVRSPEDRIRRRRADQVLLAGRGRIPAAIVGGGNDEQGGRVGVGDVDGVAGRLGPSAFTDGTQDRSKPNSCRLDLIELGLAALRRHPGLLPVRRVGLRLSLQDDAVGCSDGRLTVLLACERRAKRHQARGRARDAHDDGLSRCGREISRLQLAPPAR